jgi:hypothetical protein
MKTLTLVLLLGIFLAGCTSTQSAQRNNCIKVANSVKNNEAQSGEELFQACLDKQHQKNASLQSFGEKLAEGALFFVLDIIAS